jgi:hypothetical protein
MQQAQKDKRTYMPKGAKEARARERPEKKGESWGFSMQFGRFFFFFNELLSAICTRGFAVVQIC